MIFGFLATSVFRYQKNKTVPKTAAQKMKSILIMRGWVFIEQPLKDFAEVMLVPTQEELFSTERVDWVKYVKLLFKIVWGI